MRDLTIGFAITGSFCTFKAVFPQMNLLVEHGYRVLPIMSENAYATDTRRTGRRRPRKSAGKR